MFFRNFPFESDQMGGYRQQQSAAVDNKKLYEDLGLDRNASADDIKKAYRKLAIKHHPDKGGDPEEFKRIGRAYEVLSNPEKKTIYDEHGEAGLDGQGAADPTDIFDIFFGGSGRKGGNKVKKGEDVVSRLKVSLEQLYSGATRKLSVNRDVICKACEGNGGPASDMKTCSDCNGRGVKVQIRQMGPMIQQTQSACNQCRGQGKMMPDDKKCTTCKGSGTVKERKILEVQVERGMAHGQKIVFEGESDQRPGEIPGNVIFVVDTEAHKTFVRRGNDLILHKTITLREALLGYEIVMDHLDKRKLVIIGDGSRVVNPGELALVEGEGMPVYRQPLHKGNLYVAFEIKFPLASELSTQIKECLARVLEAPEKEKYDLSSDNTEIHHPKIVDADSVKMGDSHHHGHDDSDGEHPGQSGMQCRQQ